MATDWYDKYQRDERLGKALAQAALDLLAHRECPSDSPEARVLASAIDKWDARME